MELIELKTNIRKSGGKGTGRTLRREGRIPAILYGPDAESISLSVSKNDLNKVLKKGNINQLLLNLIIQNGETSSRTVMIKELQTHPVSRNFLHIDFYEIDMNRKIRIHIPVIAKGTAPGVELGGILQIIRRELEVLCLPSEVPESIEIDVSNLGIGESIHLNEIPIKGNVEFPEDANFTVVTILSPKVVEEEPEEVEEGEPEETEAETSEPESD